MDDQKNSRCSWYQNNTCKSSQIQPPEYTPIIIIMSSCTIIVIDKEQCSYGKVIEDLYERIGDLQGSQTSYAPNITEGTYTSNINQ